MKKKEKIGFIDSKELFINSPGKMNRSMDIVKTGCGSHGSKKDYDRKKKDWKKDF